MNHPNTIKTQEESLGKAYVNASRIDRINQTRPAL
jgi:hypothetical protein